MSERKEHNLLQTYLPRNGYFVSTAYRESSMMIPDVWYYETLVWTYDETTKKTGDLIYSNDAGSWGDSAFDFHQNICQKLFNGESLEEPRS